MRKISSILAIIAFVILTSCSATYYRPESRQIETEFVISKDKEKTWSSIIEWFGTMNIDVKRMDKVNGFLQSEGTLSPKTYNSFCDCGYVKGGMQSYYFESFYFKFNVTLVVINANTTRVRINLNYYASLNGYSYDLNRAKWILVSQGDADCKSIGYLERSLKAFLNE